MAYQTKEELETQNPTSLKQICDTIGDVTPRHIQKVADLIGTHWQDLGVKLNIPYDELETLGTPLTGGPTQYAARMFNIWYRENGHLSIAEVQENVVAALEEAKRKDVADEVRNKPLHTVNDMQRVFQEMSPKLVKHWKDVGLCLNLDFNTLLTCETSASPEDPRMKMLQMWQQRTRPAEQTTQLITALHELKLLHIIKAIGGTQAKQLPKDPTARPDDRGEDIIDARERASEEIQISDFGYCPVNTTAKQGAPIQQPRQQPKQQRQSQPPSTTRSRPSNSGGPKAKQAKSEDNASHDDNRVAFRAKTLKENQLRASDHQIKTEGLSTTTVRSCPFSDQESENVEIRDDTGDHGEDIKSMLNPDYHWMGREYKRLRDSLEGKNAKPVGIALLDTGVNTEHPDLQDIIRKHKNFIWTVDEADNPEKSDSEEDDDLYVDHLNHGTVSAGIIRQYAGEKNVQILNFKVVAHTDAVNQSDVARALKFIDDNPSLQVDIILMNFGYKGYDEDVDTLLAKMGEKKILIASAGNDGQQLPETVLSPAKHGSVIAVGACDQLNERVGCSAIGKKLDFLFSGHDIVSTSSKYHINMAGDEVDRYIKCDGTSFAAPHCAALVALVLAYVETQFPRDGVLCREKLTKSSCMRELLASFCKTDPTAKKGYGTPIFKDLVKDLIGHHMKKILSREEIQ